MCVFARFPSLESTTFSWSGCPFLSVSPSSWVSPGPSHGVDCLIGSGATTTKGFVQYIFVIESGMGKVCVQLRERKSLNCLLFLQFVYRTVCVYLVASHYTLILQNSFNFQRGAPFYFITCIFWTASISITVAFTLHTVPLWATIHTSLECATPFHHAKQTGFRATRGRPHTTLTLLCA